MKHQRYVMAGLMLVGAAAVGVIIGVLRNPAVAPVPTEPMVAEVAPSPPPPIEAPPPNWSREALAASPLPALSLAEKQELDWRQGRANACARAHEVWDYVDLIGWPEERENLPEDFRSSIARFDVERFDGECLKPWLPYLLASARQAASQKDSLVIADNRWTFVANLSGDVKLQKEAQRVRAKRERSDAKDEQELAKATEDTLAFVLADEKAAKVREDVVLSVVLYLRQNGFADTKAGVTGAYNVRMMIICDGFTDNNVRNLVAGGFLVPLEHKGFTQVTFRQGMYTGDKWPFALHPAARVTSGSMDSKPSRSPKRMGSHPKIQAPEVQAPDLPQVQRPRSRPVIEDTSPENSKLSL